ncbi:unnamed protein product [Sphagnum balticum]
MIYRSFCSATARIWAMQAKVANTVSRLRAMRSNDENFMKIYDQAEKFARDNAVAIPDCSETMFQRTQDICTWLPGTRHID